MKRAPFLNEPGLWTRAARVDQTPAEYACSIERPAPEELVSWIVWAVTGCALLLVAVLNWG